MWIERIDEKTVKCFLTNDELKEYDVSYKDFIQRNEKARALMQEVIEMATEEVGYQPPRFSFDLQITMMPTEGMLLTFSEKDPQEELSDLIAHGMGTKERGLLGQLWDSVRHMLEESDDKDLADIARLGGLDTDDETGANEMDQIGTGKLTSGTAGLGNAGSGNVGSGNAEAGKAGSKKTGSGNAGSGKAGSAKTRSGSAQSDRDNPDAADVGLAVFSFRGMRDLGTFARALPDNLKMRSSLYAWDGGYLLLLEMGEESYEKKAVTVMLRLVILFGLTFTVVTAAAPGFLMRLYTAEAAIVREGRAYLRVFAFCYIIHGVTLTATLTLRSVGKSRIPMFSSIIAFLINLAGNYAFIYGKFGAPSMGVTGAALSTLLARVFEFAFVAGYLFFGDKTVGYRLRDLFVRCLPVVREYFRIGLPVFAGEALLAVGNNVLAMVMGRIGAAFVSANAIATVTQQLSTVLLQGFSQSACILVGQMLGRSEEQKAVRTARVMLKLGLYIGLAGSILILGSANFVISVYQVTAETAAIAKQLLQVTALVVIFQSVDSVLTKGVLRGGGDTRFLLLTDTLFLWIFSVPSGAMAGLAWKLPAFLTYFFLKTDRIFSCGLCLWRLKSGKWIHTIGPVN